MKVSFKGSTKTYDCTEPTEQKVFKAGNAVGWVVMFSLYGWTNSAEVDSLLTEKALTELVFIGESNAEFMLSGYKSVVSCVIRHREDTTITELQLSKPVDVNEAKGVSEIESV